MELIKITENEEGKRLVSARELYLGLGLNKTAWSRWYGSNIEGNTFFKKGIDFIGVRHDVEGNKVQDFAISIEFAKHISMMARTEKSHEYRNYFIDCEKTVQTLNTSQLSPELHLNVFCDKFNNKWSCSVSSKKFKHLIQLLMFIRGYKNAGGI